MDSSSTATECAGLCNEINAQICAFVKPALSGRGWTRGLLRACATGAGGTRPCLTHTKPWAEARQLLNWGRVMAIFRRKAFLALFGLVSDLSLFGGALAQLPIAATPTNGGRHRPGDSAA